REPLRLFLIGLERIIGDSFCHANIGPEQTVTGELIVELLPELQNAVPNLTLLYDPAVTPDDFAIRCISCALR
ncbi:glycyl radical enzyme domain-containing protein, partial [Anaerotruncus colihominis]|uniref:glycyl radical enzyme domain-containing protein n=1 Tax=Anaerotruncus colihominis TaxID=169435 RepID=UPI00210E6A5E